MVTIAAFKKKKDITSGFQVSKLTVLNSNLKQMEVGGCEAAARCTCIGVSVAGAAAAAPLMIEK